MSSIRTSQAEAGDMINRVGLALVTAVYRDGKCLEQVAEAQGLHPLMLAMFGLQFVDRISQHLQPTIARANDPDYFEAAMSHTRAQIKEMDSLLPPELRSA